MFETSGITDAMDKSTWQKFALSFAAGCLVTILIYNMLLIPSAKRAAAESAEKAAQLKLSAELAKNPVGVQLEARRSRCRLQPKSATSVEPSLIAKRSSTTTASSSTPAKSGSSPSMWNRSRSGTTLSVTHTTTRRPSARLSTSILSGNSQHERGYQCRIRGLSA